MNYNSKAENKRTVLEVKGDENYEIYEKIIDDAEECNLIVKGVSMDDPKQNIIIHEKFIENN